MASRSRSAGLGAALAATVLAATVLAAAGCGGDDGYSDELDTQTTRVGESNSSCRGASGHPLNVGADPPGDVVACSARDGSSLHVRNVSSQVLRIRPNDLYGTTKVAFAKGVRESPALDAAHSMVGGGWDVRRETFVLPLGQSLVAKSDETVSLRADGDFHLTVAANVARYFAGWVASSSAVRGEALARPVRTCARSTASQVEEGAYVEDALRRAIEAPACLVLLDNVARERGADPTVVIPRARAQILRMAKPVLRDSLRPRSARMLAERSR